MTATAIACDKLLNCNVPSTYFENAKIYAQILLSLSKRHWMEKVARPVSDLFQTGVCGQKKGEKKAGV